MPLFQSCVVLATCKLRRAGALSCVKTKACVAVPPNAASVARSQLQRAKPRAHGPVLIAGIVSMLALTAPVHATNIAANSFAWSENAGWINFAPSAGPGVTVSDTVVSGYAWAENLGWINFSPTSGGVFNNADGVLSGDAWSENAGWISFAPVGAGVYIDTITGQFSGYAWGENIGWINFDVPSTVITTWRPSDRIFANGFD